MAALEAALGRWARAEMELPPAAAPSRPVLRRLCSGPCAPIWEFVIRHVRHPRNVKKIRGNLRWYQHVENAEHGEGLLLLGAVSQLRQELGVLGEALGGTQEAALELEAELEAGLSHQWAELRRGAELRLLGAALEREGERLRGGLEALRPPQGRGGAGPELAAALAVGMEPEVLGAVRAVCHARAELLEALLEPHPPARSDELEAATERWLQAAEALLNQHPPAEVLWALELLVLEGGGRPRPPGGAWPCKGDPDLDPEAPPTVRRLIQECWGAVGGVWGRLPTLAARLRPLRPRLAQLRLQLAQRLEGHPDTQRAARLALEEAGLGGLRQGLARGVQELQGAGGPPKPTLRLLREQLLQRRHRLGRRQRQLRALAEATGTLKARLRPLQAQAQAGAESGLGHAPLALAEEGARLRQALGALGALGEPLPRPGPAPALPACRALGLPAYKPLHEALLRAAALHRELLSQGAGPAGGAGPAEGAEPPKPHPPPGAAVGVASTKLLPRLRLVAAEARERIKTWSHLQALVSHWWEQPAQWVLATPPGGVPFSHWLHRWTRAANALSPPCPRPFPLPQPSQAEEGRGQDEPHP